LCSFGFGNLGFDQLGCLTRREDRHCWFLCRRRSRRRRHGRLRSRGLRRDSSQRSSAHAAEAVRLRVRISAAGTTHSFPSTLAYDIWAGVCSGHRPGVPAR
jgi:hypothetical protein